MLQNQVKPIDTTSHNPTPSKSYTFWNLKFKKPKFRHLPKSYNLNQRNSDTVYNLKILFFRTLTPSKILTVQNLIKKSVVHVWTINLQGNSFPTRFKQARGERIPTKSAQPP